MHRMNDTEIVKKQYATASNLSTRISIHDKYSTNKTGFGNWIFSNYRITPGAKVLELGCGTGDMWKTRSATIELCSKFVISDFSEGMVKHAADLLGKHENMEYKVIDIQEIPFEENTFDVVIANMMLYHVPDIDKGLREVRRVLKPGTCFYTATYGEHGIIEYLSNVLSAYGVKDTVNKNFTLQNGQEILSKVFSNVQKLNYEDALAVTDINDMVDYIYSMTSMTVLHTVPKPIIAEALSAHMENGILYVPKEYGMFVCS